MNNNNGIEALRRSLMRRYETLKEDLEMAAHAALKTANNELKKELKKQAPKWYNSSITDFYIGDQFVPSVYDRTGSLYVSPYGDNENDVFFMRDGENDELQGIIRTENMNPVAISRFRTGGDGLYELIFERGWHGGPIPFGGGTMPIKIAHISPKENIENKSAEYMKTVGIEKIKTVLATEFPKEYYKIRRRY